MKPNELQRVIFEGWFKTQFTANKAILARGEDGQYIDSHIQAMFAGFTGGVQIGEKASEKTE